MIPTGRHTDWFWPFSYIPRSWTGWNSDKPPKQMLGNVPSGDHLDVSPAGTWAFAWPFYFVVHFKSGWYARFGIRYDYVDHYYTFPAFTIKHLS